MKFHIDFTASDTPPLENAFEMDRRFYIVLFCFALYIVYNYQYCIQEDAHVCFVLLCFYMYQVISVQHFAQ